MSCVGAGFVGQNVLANEKKNITLYSMLFFCHCLDGVVTLSACDYILVYVLIMNE